MKALLPLLCSVQIFICLQISLSDPRPQVSVQFDGNTCENPCDVYKM